MKREDLGQYFIKNGELYYALGYIKEPVNILRPQDYDLLYDLIKADLVEKVE